MPENSYRSLLENNRDFPAFVLGGTQIRDIPNGPMDFPDRVIVSVPWTYDENPERKYPVVYLCDGYWDFPLVWSVYSHLLFDQVVPEYILVGLDYGGAAPDLDALRKVDLAAPRSDTAVENVAFASRPDYLRRIRAQIIPFVESEYRVDSAFRVLAGCSIGGTFALGAMFREPELFQAIIALSPTISNARDWLWKLEEAFSVPQRQLMGFASRAAKLLPARLFVGAGGRDTPQLVAAVSSFCSLVASRNYRLFEMEYRIVEGEKHAGLKPEGYNRGIRFAFL
jgi:hypothetical protein